MSLPFLILIAVAVPFLVLAALLSFNRGMLWMAPRPHARGWIFISIGILCIGLGAWDVALSGWQWRFSSVTQIILDLFFIAYGVYDYRRGEVQSFD